MASDSKFTYVLLAQPSSLSHSARYRKLLEQATEELAEKSLEYADACTLRQVLLCRVDLLEACSSSSSVSMVLQKIATSTWDLRPIASQRHATLKLSSYAMAFESLPTSLSQYNDELLDRIRQMTIGDAAHIYGTFVARCVMSNDISSTVCIYIQWSHHARPQSLYINC